MKTFASILAFVASSNALFAQRSQPCCFSLSTTGTVSGTVGQLSDGQNRLGGGLASSVFCIDNGGITDSEGRGCIITTPTSQFQCDAGASAATGFAIDYNGKVTHDGSSTFYECQTGENGESNIYTSPGGSDCGVVELTASSCHSGCPVSSATPSPTPTPAASITCPTNLNGNYEFPHLIIPIDSSKPNSAAGTSFNGEVSSSISSIFNFDIPESDSGKTCSLIFLFPKQSELETSSFAFSGNGGIQFSLLSGVATSATTYSNAPSVKTDYGVTTVAPGNSYIIATFACPAGTAVSFELQASGDTSLTYFQDFNPSPIGLYITTC